MYPVAERKKRVKSVPGNPLPIPLEGHHNISNDKWPVYTAVYQNGDVIVNDQDSIKALYHNGYFGQGSLSEREVDYEQYSKRISEAQYLKRVTWRNEEEKISSGAAFLPNVVYVHRDSDGGNEPHELQEDPYPLQESLILMPEEAVFLCFVTACLVVFDENNQPMNIDTLWSKLVSNDSELPYRFRAYYHFRSEQWVVRDAAAYGADYALYAVGPPFYHSQYLIKVQAFMSDTKLPLVENTITRSTYLNTLDRNACNVKKMYMMCVVLRPPSLSSVDNIRALIHAMRVDLMPFTRLVIGKIGKETESDQETS